jgi:hypothetical protein
MSKAGHSKFLARTGMARTGMAGRGWERSGIARQGNARQGNSLVNLSPRKGRDGRGKVRHRMALQGKDIL